MIKMKKIMIILVLSILCLSSISANSLTIENNDEENTNLIKSNIVDNCIINVGKITIKNSKVNCVCVDNIDELFVIKNSEVEVTLYAEYEVDAGGVTDGSWLYLRYKEGDEIIKEKEKGVDGTGKGTIELNLDVRAGHNYNIELYAYYHNLLITQDEDTDTMRIHTVGKDADLWIEEIKILPEGKIPLHHSTGIGEIHWDSMFRVECTWCYIFPYGETPGPSSTKIGTRCEGPDRWCAWENGDRDNDWKTKKVSNLVGKGVMVKKVTQFDSEYVDGGRGQHRIDVKIDIDRTPNGAYAETNEDNNERSYTFTPKYRPEEPDAPEGPTRCKDGETYTYTASTWDFDSDELLYQFDWDDDTKTEWLGPYSDNVVVSAEKTWYLEEGSQFLISVKVKDSDGYTSESGNLVVKCSKNKEDSNFLSYNLVLRLYQFLHKILR
jgi:hypothetical protein